MAKVIAAVVKFSREQTENIITREEQKVGLVSTIHTCILLQSYSYTAVVDLEGGATGVRPLKFDRLCFSFFPFCIRMLNNKAQIAQESIKKPQELPGPLSGPLTKAVRDFGLRACDVCARTKSFAPPPPNENPGSAPALRGGRQVSPPLKRLGGLLRERHSSGLWEKKLSIFHSMATLIKIEKYWP